MTTATRLAPAVIAAPEPVACSWCSADARRACLMCLRSGREAVTFELAPTRTYRTRRVWFQQLAPALVGLPVGMFCGYLTVSVAKTQGGKLRESRYRVREFEVAKGGGRGFIVGKVGGDVHHVLLSGNSVRCDCKAGAYLPTEKANQRAWECGRQTFASKGCAHADALSALRDGGWL
jgi:hypothetical protein